jgi:hypothetical protein
VCDNQLCTSCAAQGASCANASCCGGLECYGTPPTCQSCKPDGELCTLASECCSNVCDLGKCVEDMGCNPGDCSTCVQTSCALTACAAENAACNADPECVAIVSCATQCTDTNCTQQCALAHPDGITEAQALQMCACDPNVCGIDCAGSLCF